MLSLELDCYFWFRGVKVSINFYVLDIHFINSDYDL
jgi:hypothetical protein